VKLACVALLAACSGNGSTTTRPADSTGMESSPPSDHAAFVAVLRHEIAAGGVQATEVVCIRVRGGDDPGPIIAEVAKTSPTAIDGGRCTGGGMAPVVGPNGEPAVMFDVGPLERDDTGMKMKGGGAHRGGGRAIEIEYRLEPDGAGFRVASQRTLLQT